MDGGWFCQKVAPSTGTTAFRIKYDACRWGFGCYRKGLFPSCDSHSNYWADGTKNRDLISIHVWTGVDWIIFILRVRTYPGVRVPWRAHDSFRKFTVGRLSGDVPFVIWGRSIPIEKNVLQLRPVECFMFKHVNTPVNVVQILLKKG